MVEFVGDDVEMVLDGALAAAADEDEVIQPAAMASSTAYWMRGLSTTGIISLALALVAGRRRVPSPATRKNALRISGITLTYPQIPLVTL